MIDALGQYRILGPIGAGHLGELFRARDTRAGRTVALRIVAKAIAGDGERRRRLVSDAREVAALSHPSIAGLYEVGEQDETLFLVTEYVPGDTLSTLIAGRALNARHALDHGIQLADALATGHAAGVIHRDVHPAGIIVTPKGMAKFVDFGLARWTTSGRERRQLADVAGDDAGSSPQVVYMAPEEALGAPVDWRADIFSLGAVLFEMVAGTPPPLIPPSANASTADVLLAPPVAPSAINPASPPELDPIVLKMLARDPDDRYQSAATIAAQLRAAAVTLDAREDQAAAGSPTTSEWRRFAGVSILLVLFAILTIVALVWMLR